MSGRRLLAPACRQAAMTWRQLSLGMRVILVMAAGLALPPYGWQRYFTAGNTFYDAEHYVRIAQTGYDDLALAAFYPLWPLLLRVATWWTKSPTFIASCGGLLALLIFLSSLRILNRVYMQAFGAEVATVVLALYAFNPTSVFHALPYAESLTSLFYALTLLELHRPAPRTLLLAFWTAALALSRPILPILPMALVIAALTTCRRSSTGERRQLLRWVCAMLGGSIIGYAAFGAFCWWQFGDFLAPYAAQSLWHRQLGLHWQLFTAPQTVGGSPEVLFSDLIAFYGPPLLAGSSLLTSCPQANTHCGRPFLAFNFWWTTLVACGYGAVAFLTYPEFMSLGRHVLCLPLFYYSLGVALTRFPWSRSVARLSSIAVTLSAVFYWRWWLRYGRGWWLG